MFRKHKTEEYAPWRVPVDILKPGANKKIKKLGEQARRLEELKRIKIERKKVIKEIVSLLRYLFFK